MTATFRSRMALAEHHEATVIGMLRDRNWDAESFGQGQLSELMRHSLRHINTYIRWMPDIIATRNIAGRNTVIYIDAKAGKRYLETGNHDIETAALEAAERWVEFNNSQCPYYFVFDDGATTTPEDVRDNCRPGRYNGNGSGTPFVLFPREICRPFDAIFGQPNH